MVQVPVEEVEEAQGTERTYIMVFVYKDDYRNAGHRAEEPCYQGDVCMFVMTAI